MSMHSDEPLDLDGVSSATSKISGSAPRYAFQPKEFNKVEESLVAQENRSSEEIQDWKKNYELIEKKYEIAVVNNTKVKKDMRECRRQLDALTEQVTRLEEDKRLLNDKVAVYEERGKCVQAKYAKLLEDNERLGTVNMELVVRISETYSMTVKAERELESVQKKNEEIELRVCRIEEFMDRLLSQPRFEEEKDLTNVINANGTPMGTRRANMTGAEVKEVIFNGHGKGDDSVDTNANRLKRDGTGFGLHPCNEGQTVLERGDSSHRDKRQKTVTAAGKTETGVVIDISDSDDETPTHNQTPNVPKGSLPDGGNQCTSYLGIGERVNGGNNKGFTFSSSSSESCDSETIYELLNQRRGSS